VSQVIIFQYSAVAVTAAHLFYLDIWIIISECYLLTIFYLIVYSPVLA